jgi:hypothetical protein
VSPSDLQLLASLCDPGNPVDFAALPDLAEFLDRPQVQAQLAAILTIRDIRYHARLQEASLSAIATLQEIIHDTGDLTEKRRAATSILRTVRPAAPPSHQRRPAAANSAAHRATSRAHATLLTPGAAPIEVPPHFKPLSTAIYSDIPSRSLKPRQVIANALALIQQGDTGSLQALFAHCTHRGRFQTRTPEDFVPLARQHHHDLLHFQAAFAAPFIQTARQRGRQDLIIITRPGEPIAFTVHLNYPMFGDHEYCWLIDHFSPPPRHSTTPADGSPVHASPRHASSEQTPIPHSDSS